MKLTKEVWNELLSGLALQQISRDRDDDLTDAEEKVQQEAFNYLNFIGKEEWKEKVIDDAKVIKKIYA